MDRAFKEALEAARPLDTPTAADIRRLGDRFGEDLARRAIALWGLRRRAREKFSRAADMLFDRDGLEMASHESVATFHASRFPRGANVADLTCGLGADLIALGLRGPAVGFDTDPFRVEMARHNVAVYGSDAVVDVADCLEVEWDFEFAVADPARRSGGKSRLSLEESEPSVAALVPRMRKLKLGLMKLSPLTPDESLKRLDGSVGFVSFAGQCREALVAIGSEAEPFWGAILVEPQAMLAASSQWADSVPDPDAWFFEADPAAIRAGCLGTLAAEYGLRLLGDSNGYLTGPSEIETPWLSAYRVLDTGKGDESRTLAELSRLGAATPDVKTRGKGLDADRLRKALRGTGNRKLHVAVWRNGARIRHAIVERVPH